MHLLKDQVQEACQVLTNFCWNISILRTVNLNFTNKDNPTEPIEIQKIEVKETNVRLGKKEDFPSYGWDNEYGLVECRLVQSFKI